MILIKLPVKRMDRWEFLETFTDLVELEMDDLATELAIQWRDSQC